jgi:hypothetical protein
MNISRPLFAVLAACSMLPITSALAQQKAAPEPAASRYYPLVGMWQGEGKLQEGSQPTVSLNVHLNCKKASSGWAVICEMRALSSKTVITETDLMGVDPITGVGHWYAITNQGETHDHIAEWPDARTMKAHYAWTQDGKKTDENITYNITGAKTMEFRSIITQNGKEVASFSGKLGR